jgi:YbbR domain-containing protein
MPPLGYTAEASVSPGEVDVSGPASRVEDLKEIKTEPVELHGAPEPLQRSVLLSWAGDFVSFAPDHVIVNVRYQPTMMSRRFEHVEVTIRNAADGVRAKLVPPRLDLTVQGPQSLLSTYRLEDGSVWVDAAGLQPGTYRVTPHVEVPQALEVTRREPEVQSLELTSAPRGSR